ncbi:ras GTPase-activating protein 1-like [Oxyura jamaicensis]|uniref:ras GTPase-activating protein 1-like n=1 Tax=Oxyura jamaicensis TaxID=8884 RepID=UPI0015A526FA|nr:ras GTPase-activating protein 1-like [Oxyura jamaicensis]
MMAAEGEEDVSVTSVRMIGTVGRAEPGHYPALWRSKELGSQGHFLVGSGKDSSGASGPALCSALGLLALGSGSAPLASGGGGAVTPASQGPEVSGGALPEPGSVVFSLLPLQPSSLAGGLGTVDEGDSLDGPEYEEEEVAIPLNAPPTNQWYHGKLERAIAEERLWQAGKPGTYLIRESDRRPGSFVLSFLSKTNVNHFRIIAMCGDYYIGGRRFASLLDLIGYYSHVSCLLKGEKLFFPVAPPEPVEDRRRVRAILPYTKVPETDEISFLKGDMFIVHNELEDGWMWVTNLRTDEQGLIVDDLVEEVGREEDPHEGKIWFHGKISKQEAYNLLMTVGQVCSFLVRPSDNTPGDYSLYFRTSENIQRFKICPTSNNQFMMGGRYYNSIDEIIEHYRKEQIVEGYYLKDPVPMQHQEQVLNNTVDGKEIYNTIRRKTKDAFYKNIVKKGYLLKKSKGKRWKNLYFILEGNDAHLIYFESEKRATKPKGLIDLSVCSIYGVHDSLFGRPNCFQIVVQHFSEEHYIFYFAGETPEQTQDWMKALQMFCSLRKNNPGKSNKRLRQVSSLILHVEEAHTLPVKHFTNLYCNIYRNTPLGGGITNHSRTLRYIYGCLQKSVQNKWPANTTMRTRVVSGFVFLRLICPAILNPRMFNIISDSPSPTAARTLTLVAKSVQNLANLVEFGAKEPYMEGVNPFIKSNKHRMIMFLDELGNVPELPDTTEHSRTDLSRYLAALHEMCVAHSDELRTLSNERGVMQHVLKKLLAITELLQQKQNQYLVSNNIR